MNILQVSMQGAVGGAGKAAVGLHRVYCEFGHKSMLAIGYPTKNDLTYPGVFRMPNNKYRRLVARGLYFLPDYLRNLGVRGTPRFIKAASTIAEPKRYLRRRRGYEDYDFPATQRLIDLAPEYPHIVHCHNLHTDYFDIRILPSYSLIMPIVLTLHDMWLLTGHCAHSMECRKWLSGCGECPDLSRYPSVKGDKTKENWEIKREILGRSGLYIATPSEWLMDLVRQSKLRISGYRVINNGVDTRIYRPQQKEEVRHRLGLPLDAKIIITIGDKAGNQKNIYKDYGTVRMALKEIGHRMNGNKILVLNVGSANNKNIRTGDMIIKNYGYIQDEYGIAQLYQASDIFLYATHADTFPTVILESMACGTPAIATSVGGIPEQIKNALSGYLVPEGNYLEMADRAVQILLDNQLHGFLSKNAVEDVKGSFSLHHQAKQYLDWYEEILEHWPQKKMDSGA